MDWVGRPRLSLCGRFTPSTSPLFLWFSSGHCSKTSTAATTNPRVFLLLLAGSLFVVLYGGVNAYFMGPYRRRLVLAISSPSNCNHEWLMLPSKALRHHTPHDTTYTALIRTKYCFTKPNIIIVWWGSLRQWHPWLLWSQLAYQTVTHNYCGFPRTPSFANSIWGGAHIKEIIASPSFPVDPQREEWKRIFLAHAWPRKSSSAVLTFINTTRASTANKLKLGRRNNKSTPTHYDRPRHGSHGHRCVWLCSLKW